MLSPGTPGRDANFDDKRRNFEAHSARLADTANMVATAAGCRNKKTVEEIFKSSKQVKRNTNSFVLSFTMIILFSNLNIVRWVKPIMFVCVYLSHKSILKLLFPLKPRLKKMDSIWN